MRLKQLDHVALHVRDLEESRRFYGEVLKLQPLPRPAFDFPGAWFRLGASQELHLIAGRNREVISSPRGNHYALQVDDLAVWERHLRDVETPFQGPVTRPDGARQIFLSDPDGHVIELCQAS